MIKFKAMLSLKSMALDKKHIAKKLNRFLGRRSLPSDVNSAKELTEFKVLLGEWLKRIPDRPPVPGYTRQNNNSIMDWTRLVSREGEALWGTDTCTASVRRGLQDYKIANRSGVPCNTRYLSCHEVCARVFGSECARTELLRFELSVSPESSTILRQWQVEWLDNTFEFYFLVYDFDEVIKLTPQSPNRSC